MLRSLGSSFPEYATLVEAIRGFERFARALQDAFDCLRHAAGDSGMLELPLLGSRSDFIELVQELPSLFASAERAFAAEGGPQGVAFASRFIAFGTRLAPAALANELLAHHMKIQRDKSASGKRAWFDAVDDDRRYWRPNYRLPQWEPRPAAFAHDYRCAPIRRFRKDLA